MKLISALRVKLPISMSFVGAGGKTTAIFRAARELLSSKINDTPIKTVLVTTTTHFGAWQSTQADQFVRIASLTDINQLEKNVPEGIVLLADEEKNQRLVGLSDSFLIKVHYIAQDHRFPLLIEADGSHTCPLKAPGEHEPAIPDLTDSVVVVAGISGLGKPLTGEWVHRYEKFTELSGLRPGEEITREALVKVLLHSGGGLKNIPSHARRLVLLNQADTPELQSQAREISAELVAEYRSSVISSLIRSDHGFPSHPGEDNTSDGEVLASIEPIGGIILAAGESSRFGQPKQLLLWKGEPLIRHVAYQAMRAGLSPIAVVVGSEAKLVEAAIKDLPVRIVNNPQYSTGLSTSIKAGLTAITDVGGVVFLQADQPQIPHTLIQRLVKAHQETLMPITAPQVNGQRGNPVLFDASTFDDLLSLEGDTGGRVLFTRFPACWVAWNDPNILVDIDSPDDYQHFLQIYPEGRIS